MKINELLQKFTSNTCSVEEESAAKEWLMTNIANPAYDAEFEHLLDSTIPIENNESKLRVNQRLNRFVEAEIDQRKSNRIRKIAFGFLSTCACAAVALCLFLIHDKADQGHKCPDPVVWHEAYAKIGETNWISLADGTRLWLNSGTKVIYPSSFNGDTRNIFIDGEIYAEVTSDMAKPFIVSSSGINVKVHGTQFSVKSFAGRENVEVALISGCVTMEDVKAENNFQRTLLPGEFVRYNTEIGTVESYSISPDTYGAWRNNHNIRYINHSLKDIVEDLSRRFKVNIVIEDQTLAKTRYYASFINNEGLEQILHALNHNNSMKISKRADTIIISENK